MGYFLVNYSFLCDNSKSKGNIIFFIFNFVFSTGNKLKHKDLNIQSDAELKHTFKNSAFIALGALGAHIIAQALPMTHLLEYGTTIGIVTGVAGMVTAKVQENKNKRPKM